MRGKKVFVAMSGGVDSSVAALLLKRQGYSVVGVFMRCWGGSPSGTLGIDRFASLAASCAEADAEDARRVAEKLGIPFYVWDMEEEYKKRVVEYMVEGYRQGLTPNPDVMCNREIKFGLFLERALALGAQYVATGHHVQLKRTSGTTILFQAKDSSKDQSYFLWTLTQRELRRCLFPIGKYLKRDVRAIAKRAGLPTAEKKDSQGICFLGKVTLSDFLKKYIPQVRGSVYATTGERIGEHDGAYFYTIGQRHGLKLGSKNYELRIKGKVETKPHYVAQKDVQTNTIIVAEGSDNPALYRKEVKLADVNFISPIIPNSKFIIPVLARVRYRQPLVAATLSRVNGSNYKLVFDTPQKFVAAGQSAVFYEYSDPSAVSRRRPRELRMLGGGVIAA